MYRICYLADGKSIHTQRWCEYFLSQGFEIHLITFRATEIPGVTVHFVDSGNIEVSGNNKKVLLKVPQIRRILRKIKPDIVHAHYATSYGITGALSGFHPLVVTALGSDVLISPFQNKWYKILLRYVFRKADWITAMSDPMKEVMISLGAAQNKMDTVIFGIDPNIFNDRNRNISADTFTIISTRNFEDVYNIEVLVEALALVRQKIQHFKVHLIGAGSKETQIRSLVEKLQLSDIVEMHGRLPQLQIAELLRTSQVFVSVSSSDGNNISLNEAMACGCFSVVSDIPANRQWIEDGINGFFSQAISAEAIAAKILEAHDSYNHLIVAANAMNQKVINEKAIWKTNMQKVEQHYLKLCKHE